MSDPPTDFPEDQLSSEDQQLFEVLDQYVDLLHKGKVHSRSQLLRMHPELANLMSCLEGLDSLSPHQGESAPAFMSSPDQDATVLQPSDGSETPRSGTSTVRISPPRFFGKYELLGELGRGGMGVVFRARQSDLKRTVALKMILSSHLATEDEIRRFYAEARAAGGVRHPNVVHIYEVGQENGQHYFTMDYVEGPSLAEVMGGKPLDCDQAAEYLRTIACAVDYLHCNHIIHRDLKPSNILMDKSRGPLVTDFGLAKLFEDDGLRTQTGMIVGTPSYMAPEQAGSRTAEVSQRSDIYSLGAILYEMLTGRPPFKETNPLDTLMQVLENEPQLPTRLNRSIPRELELICLKCLEKDPDRRYQTAGELAADLDRYLKREPIEARTVGYRHRINRWGRRQPALAARLLALAVSMIIVQMAYHLWGYDLPYHLKVMSVFGVWAAVSILCQQLLAREILTGVVPFAWAASDAILLTRLLALADPPLGMLLVGYPLLITACGLFFQVRLVIFMTVVSLLSFTVLCMIRREEFGPPQYPIIFGAVLLVMGLVVAYQVYRIRVLSRYFEHHQGQ